MTDMIDVNISLLIRNVLLLFEVNSVGYMAGIDWCGLREGVEHRSALFNKHGKAVMNQVQWLASLNDRISFFRWVFKSEMGIFCRVRRKLQRPVLVLNKITLAE